jgi:hypothetical protein
MATRPSIKTTWNNTPVSRCAGLAIAIAGAHNMNTFKLGTDPSPGDTDFVSTDAAELASHMNHCASSHSRFFSVHSALQSAHGALSPRIVTVAALATGGLGLALIILA